MSNCSCLLAGKLGHRLAGIIPYGCIFDSVGLSSTAGRYNLHILYTHGQAIHINRIINTKSPYPFTDALSHETSLALPAVLCMLTPSSRRFTTGALDKICGYGGDLNNGWRTVGARKQIIDIAEARKYPVGSREKMCATDCDLYTHCFQVRDLVKCKP